jgi:Ca2+-binding RTX toxin-like protein
MEPLDRRVMMAITASLDATHGVLTVTGDAQDNSISVAFNAAGAIVVNNGAVPIQGGTSTPANTRLIRIFALGGNDNLAWSGSANLPSGQIEGGSGNDTITSGTHNDLLIGGAGNDTYRLDTDATLGSDIIDESAGGADTIDFSSTTTRGVNIDLSNPAAQVVNAGLTLTLSAGNTIENLIGGARGDALTGNSLSNVFEGGGGNDDLRGGAGNDTYRFDTDNALGIDAINEVDTIFDSGSGIDRLDFSSTATRALSVNLGIKGEQVVNDNLTLGLGIDTIENVTGGALGDTLTGNVLNNTLEGGAGNDTLSGGVGNDIYRFDTDNALGSDKINETSGSDTLDFSATTTRAVTINLANAAAQVVNAGLTLTLSAGNTIENVTGGALADTVTGNTLNNAIEGGGGNDTLSGGTGNDTYRFDTDNALGSDKINEAGGSDTLDFSPTTTRAVTINLANAAAQVVNAGLTLTLSAGNTIENVTGGALNDTITGNALSNLLAGGAGNDTVTGAAGNDTLIGGSGTDVLNGGTGTNILAQ